MLNCWHNGKQCRYKDGYECKLNKTGACQWDVVENKLWQSDNPNDKIEAIKQAEDSFRLKINGSGVEKMNHNKKEPKRKLGRVLYKIQGFDNDGSIDFIDNGLGLNLHCEGGIYELELSDIPPFISFLKNYIGEDV